MKTMKLVVFGALMISALVGGVARQLVAPYEVIAPIDIPFMLLSVFLLFFWYRLDSEERGYNRSLALNAGVIALAVVAMPYYFFRTRGLARGAAASAVFLIAGVLYSLLQYAGTYLAYVAIQS